MAIHFFVEDIENFFLAKKEVKLWIRQCILNYNKKIGNINLIFCSDEYLKNINNEYLKHDYYTDIITFNYTERNTLHSDIYISTERVLENSKEFNVSFSHEIHRVIIHGILHLIGFNDITVEEQQLMRQTEDQCLSLFPKE